MKPSFYYDGHHHTVAERIKRHINSSNDFLSPRTTQSTRAVGDALETLVSEKFEACLGDWVREYSSDFARRAMADLAFTDRQGFYSAVDVKTHREDTRFNMPNLISVERLARFYESDANIFSILLIKYKLSGTSLTATEVLFTPIEFLDWQCLTVGGLGWGQIQIADSNRIFVTEQYSRKKWMLDLCKAMGRFYPKEVDKIRARIERFDKVRDFWESKDDSWV